MSGEKNIEQLLTELLQSENAEADAKALAVSLEAEQSEAQQQIDQLSSENDSLKAENDSLKAQLQGLVAPPANKEAASAVGECFELDGKKYQVLFGFVSIPGIGKRSALELLADTDAQAYLVAKSSPAIREVI